jgi:F-type H+-transporting ATPase subunit epsilon
MVAVDRKLDFEIVSPERLLLSEPVDMAVIPGSEGDFGVLVDHSLMIATLRPGVIEVWQGEQVTERLFVAGGFAEVTGDRCTVLADEAVRVDEIDAATVQAELEKLRGEIDAAETDERPNSRPRERPSIDGGARPTARRAFSLSLLGPGVRSALDSWTYDLRPFRRSARPIGLSAGADCEPEGAPYSGPRPRRPAALGHGRAGAGARGREIRFRRFGPVPGLPDDHRG